ncbi:uncharacterized protein K444DRAFT_629266 [Hyaloscypha bicolor E]|uniref:Carbohydrate-binding module family 52 protein n=1 Tax=Hyaloscypha bicolor E TaxID=1095630 RepID=A0A2J6TCN8_9HELO|nr:uncharacterized protein K444DRAFT_629266 [Hyaloscypha bicolor E]PMD60795.1 hypothetical protein K444DRAFT_629266 [Hyaloscypha bicolor E]
MKFELALTSFFLRGVFSQACSSGVYGALTCGSPSASYCESASLEGSIIFRCTDGCEAPPYGVKQGALCWQDSPTAGDAQCTFDCVNVTAVNGSTFYPVGCSFTLANTTAPPSSVSLNLPTAASTPPSSTTSQVATTHTSKSGVEAMRVGGGTAMILGLLGLFL